MEGIIDNLFVNRELYAFLFGPVCEKYHLTMTEMVVLMFLAKNTSLDTASDIVENLKITKSHVSISLRDLEERGYVKGDYLGENHRTIHLKLCDGSFNIIKEGENIHKEFIDVLLSGFSQVEKDSFMNYIGRINHNANAYLHKKLELRRK
ncbi:MAG: MarR family winged helix-turn-helix transcriptional regulator [Bacilli bacterium]